MANARDIKRRISSVQATERITNTMKLVAAAKVGAATRRVEVAEPYTVTVRSMMKSLASATKLSTNPLLAVHDSLKNAIIIMIESDRGLAGGFNSEVSRRVDAMVRQMTAEGASVRIIACGKKAIQYCKFRKYNIMKEYKDLSADPTLAQAREISTLCINEYSCGNADGVYIVFNHARNVADQDLISSMLLPIQPPRETKIAQAIKDASDFNESSESVHQTNTEDQKVTAPFEYEPDEQTVLSVLLPSYINSSVYHALVDSAAAEQGARRKAMTAATDNANEMIVNLSKVYNRVRQDAITTELTEIISGANAVEE